MQKIPLEIIIPIYNEGANVVKLLNEFKNYIKTSFRVLLCYDLDDDNIFEYKEDLKKYEFEVILVKNPSNGPCSAIKKGLYYGNSDCVVVYPADDFLNIKLIDKMFDLYKFLRTFFNITTKLRISSSVKALGNDDFFNEVPFIFALIFLSFTYKLP